MNADVSSPVYRPLCDLDLQLEPSLIVRSGLGMRVIAIVNSGTVRGRINGRALPGGGDWLLIDRDRVGHVDVRLMLELEDSAIVDVTYRGRLILPADGLSRLSEGNDLAPDEVYFRVAMEFNAPPGDHQWLNSIVAVGVGEIGAGWVRYQVSEVL
jgi:hypothetical protein